MLIETAAAWLLTIMIAVAPPGRSKSPHAAETPEEGAARYALIAGTVARVAFDEAEAPFPGGRERTALVMLSVAFMESGFRRDVDLGIGPHAKGDKGRSCGLWQANIGRGKTAEGWTCADIVGDREKAARSALAMMRKSAGACRWRGADYALTAYAGGAGPSCEIGATAGKKRLMLAIRWGSRYPAPRAGGGSAHAGAKCTLR